jgi:hypothetical protein
LARKNTLFWFAAKETFEKHQSSRPRDAKGPLFFH